MRVHEGKAGGAAAAGVDWAAGPQASMLQLVYNVYTEKSYDVIWDHYAYRWPPEWWFPQVRAKEQRVCCKEVAAPVVLLRIRLPLCMPY